MPKGKKPIEQYDHKGKKRVNNPPVGLVTPETDKETGKKAYAYDPHLDPQLVWAGKAEHTSFEVPTVSLHVHERIDPRTIIEAVRKRNGHKDSQQLSLFSSLEENPPLRDAIEFYKHKHNWSNRLIAGDSLLVMNSLLEKEGLAGQVQMIYIDPPYGIKYGSNFQPFVNKRDVKDGKDEDLTAEPEMIKAFRDTWELEVHSYLTYLRDRLLLSRELLSESGSIFVQISDENLHLVRALMDEVFGRDNFCSLITFSKTSGFGAKLLNNVADYLLWYAKDKAGVKYRPLFAPKSPPADDPNYRFLELPSGERRKMTPVERENPKLAQSLGKVMRFDNITSAEAAGVDQPFVFKGETFRPGQNLHWKTTIDGMKRLMQVNRMDKFGSNLAYVRYWSDFPYISLENTWADTATGGFGDEKIFVVQTTRKTVERCILMTTDPGDLVLDPTCVRKGTRVWVVGGGDPPVIPPNSGGQKRGAAIPNSGGQKRGAAIPNSGGQKRGAAIPNSGGQKRGAAIPYVGRRDTGSLSASGEGRGEDDSYSRSLPVNGEGQGGMTPHLVPIETIRHGDMVLAHDGQPHRVLRTIRRSYRGKMMGIRHSQSTSTLWLTADHRVLAKRRPRSLGGNCDWSAVPLSHWERRKELRREMTPPEHKLWQVLRRKSLGVKFRRQHSIGPYIADFYSRDAQLIVEVDGVLAHSGEDAAAHDSNRDAFMQSLGLRVLRVPAVEVERNLESVFEAIKTTCDELKTPEGAEWVEAADLCVGDIIFADSERIGVRIEQLTQELGKEEVYDLEVEGAHSFLTEVCVVHNCGSGTTAYVAEHWGRRWITCDTSRVALTLAKQRLMTALYDYYELAHPEEGVASGFRYKTVPHITLKSIANNEPPGQETLYDQPFIDNSRARVSGPFTVEAVPAPVVKPLSVLEEEQPADESVARSGETLRQAEWRDELLKTGIRGKRGQYIMFSRVEPLPGTRWLHADAETKPNERGADSVRETPAPYGQAERAVISFGPEHAPLEQRQVELAIEEAQRLVPRPKIIVFAAFQFDPEAAKDIDETEWPGVTLLKAQMNADLLTEDLKKKRASNDSFWLIGQPDVRLEKMAEGKDKGKYRVEVLGFDYYNTKTGTVESGGTANIAMWMLDTDYDGRSLFSRQVFFPMADDKQGWSRLARNLKAEIDEELIEAYRGTVSLPFEPGENRRVAVKIVDDRGIESLKIIEVE